MSILALANLTHAHGDQIVLDGASLTLQRGQRVGLVGRNGCGKTTLMRIITGQLQPDGGQVQLARSAAVGYLAQEPDLDSTNTLRREAENAFADLAALHDQREQISHAMAEASGAALDKLMSRYERVERDIDAAGGYAIDHRIDATLHGLGLGDQTFDVPVSGLSGGQKARLALAMLLLRQPDVLLLDEPTNHLDIAGRQWLEQFLLNYDGAVMLVSHDRWLLDEVTDRIVELERGKLVEYPGNYAAYRQQKAVRQLEQQRVRDKQDTWIRHQKQYIQRYKTGQRAKEARGRQKKLERFIRDELVDQAHHQGVMNFKLPAARRSGDLVVSADALHVQRGEKQLVRGFSISLKRGQRIGVIGPNGCGKSSLTRTLISRDEPTGGTVRLGANVSVGYYHQTHEHLDDDQTPVSYLRRRVPDEAEQSARDLAGAFLFSGTDQDKPFGVLSGGERTRAVLAGLMVGGHNLLVLDEPSNHLDIPSAERLEHALNAFDGTLLLITHDRQLLQDTVDELLVFEEGSAGRVRHFIGSYRDYLEARAAAETVGPRDGGEGKREDAKAGAREEASGGGRRDAKGGAREGASGGGRRDAKGGAREEASGGGRRDTKGGAREEASGGGRRDAKAGAREEASTAQRRDAKAGARRAAGGSGGKLWHLSDEQLEQRIMKAEAKLAELDERLASPELYRDRDQFNAVHQERKKLAAELEPLEAEWLTRAESA